MEFHPIVSNTLYENAIVSNTLPIISPYFAIYCNKIQFALAILPCLYGTTRTPSCALHQNYPSTCHFRFFFRHGSYSNATNIDLGLIAEHCLRQRLWLQCSFDFGTIYVSFFNFISNSLTLRQHSIPSTYSGCSKSNCIHGNVSLLSLTIQHNPTVVSTSAVGMVNEKWRIFYVLS